tara:strand:+ start:531 stop:1946 length:1416 start_codon:yes stop_codon:yes gene_type:complete
MSVLGTTVFKVPKLGETGFKIDQINEQKQKQKQAQLQKQVDGTGAEKAYMENAMGLTGIYKQIADAEYSVFRKAAIEFEQTGSSRAEAAMKKAAGELTYSVTAGRSILDVAGKEYVTNKANGFKDVALSPEEASDLYSGFTNRTGEVIIKNGQVMVKDGDTFVPATQSTYLQSSVNINNSLVLPRTITQGKYVNFSSFLSETRGAISAGSSVVNAQGRVNTLFEQKYLDKQFQADVLTAYAVSQDDGLGMVEDPNKISAEQLSQIADLAGNEEIVAQAKAWYQERVLNSVPPLWSAGSASRSPSIGRGSSKDIEFVEDETVSFTILSETKDGWVVDDKTTEDISFDTYGGLQTNLQGKGITDARKFKYDIVGIGVKDGRIYADKQAVEDSGFWSLESGKQFQRKAEKMTRSEFTRLPTETRDLLKMKFGDDLAKMLGDDKKTEPSDSKPEDVNSTEEEKEWDANEYAKKAE